MVIENKLTSSLATLELDVESRLDSLFAHSPESPMNGFRRNYIDMVIACWEVTALNYRIERQYQLEYQFWEDKVKGFSFSPPEPEVSLLMEQFADYRQIECLLLMLLDTRSTMQVDAFEEQIKSKMNFIRETYPSNSGLQVYDILLAHFKNLSVLSSESTTFSLLEFEELRQSVDDKSLPSSKIAFAFYALDFFNLSKSFGLEQHFESCLEPLPNDYVGMIEYLYRNDHRVLFPNNLLNNIWMCRWRSLLCDNPQHDESEESDSSSYASDPPSDSDQWLK